MKQDKQPRRASKSAAPGQLHPASDMGKRAKGGDKFSNRKVPSPMRGDSTQPQTSVGRKAKR